MVSTSASRSGRHERTANGAFAVTFGKIPRPCLFESGGKPCAQLAQLRLFPLEESQAGPQGFARVLISAGGNQPVDEIGLRIGQYDVSCSHAAGL